MKLEIENASIWGYPAFVVYEFIFPSWDKNVHAVVRVQFALYFPQIIEDTPQSLKLKSRAEQFQLKFIYRQSPIFVLLSKNQFLIILCKYGIILL